MPWWLTLTQQSAVGFFHPGCLRAVCEAFAESQWGKANDGMGAALRKAQGCWGKKKIPFTSFYWLQGPREPCRTSVGCGIMTKQFRVLSNTRIAKKKKSLQSPWRAVTGGGGQANSGTILKTIRKCTVLTKSFSQVQAQRKKVLRGAANSKHAKEEPELHLWLL